MARKWHILFVKHSDRWKFYGGVVEANDYDYKQFILWLNEKDIDYFVTSEMRPSSIILSQVIREKNKDELALLWSSGNGKTCVYKVNK